MKKLLLSIGILFSTLSFSQPITVNSTNYTVPQLVNNVLINSPCVSATNITWRTGTNFGSSNGIGFFQNTNSNLPMQSGVILSTGNASNTPGPNVSMLNDGSSSWTGDANLEATLAAAGIPMASTNASVLEFDFTPISPNFSFDFVFASEEYGNYQCQFSDAFAFLLTNLNTGETTNLAVVPNTTTPISVVTIRDFIYNSSCASVNQQYFGRFNGGSAAATSAINFNGQTILLTAESVLTPNTPYHIKLVVADRSDYQSDSAIFISSDSFNIGQDVLGQDLTVANNTAICPGSSYTLNTGLNPANYTFTWSQGEGTIEGEVGPSLIVTQPGIYSVTYTNTLDNCIPQTDYITVENSIAMTIQNPTNLYKCNTGAIQYTFDLSLNTTIVTTGLPNTSIVSYHLSLNDANNNVNPLPNNYPSAGNQIIYVRIVDGNSLCVVVKNFQLLLTIAPIAYQPLDLIKCVNPTVTSSIFNLTTRKNSILNGQSSALYTVSYFTTLSNANNNINAINTPQNYASGNAVIYARVQNVYDPTCFSTTSFNLVLYLNPLVDTLENVIVCTNYVLHELTNGYYFTGINGTGTPLNPGDIITQTQTIYIFNQPEGPGTCKASSQFKVTIIDPETLSPSDVTSCGQYTLPALTYGSYYTATSGNGTQIPQGTVLTASQTLHYYFVAPTAPFCVIDTEFNVTINPSISVGDRENIFNCTSYILPTLTVGHYYTAPQGNSDQIPAGTVITSSQTIYVYAETTGAVVCSDEDSFEILIGINTPTNIAQCNGYTLPALPIGNYYTGAAGTGTQIAAGTVINETITLYVYVSTTGINCTDDIHFNISISQPPVDTLVDQTACDNFVLPILTNGNYFTEAGGTGVQLSAGDVLTATQTIYIYSQLSSTCANQSSFTITINPMPQIDSRGDVDVCNAYVLTPLTNGNYFTEPNGMGTMLTDGSIITSSQTIYIYAATNATPPCILQNSFNVSIFVFQADNLSDVIACDNYTLMPLTNGDYYTQTGGPHGTGTLLHAGDVISTSTTLYIYVESGERSNCSDENIFNITINQTPVLAPMANKYACNSYTLPTLAIGNYYTGTNGTGNLLNTGDILTSSQTIYVYAQTNTTPNCTVEMSFSVTIFNVDINPNITICEGYTLPALTVGNYYTGQNGSGTMLPTGAVVSTSQTVYIFAQSTFNPTCSDESSFIVTIIDTPTANLVPASIRTVCDEDGTNDGITLFNLTGLSTTILGTQTGSEFSIAYYETFADATNGSNPITTTSLSTVYVRVNNSLAPSCFDVKPIVIIVKKLPEPSPANGIICIDSETGTLLNPYTIFSGLSASNHTFEWTNEAGEVVGSGSSYQAILPGNYTIVATNTVTGCVSEPVVATVNPSEPAIVTYTVSDDFTDQQTLTIVANGVGGDYEYQLDGGQFQDSPIFENVTSGVHNLYVRDKNGCGATTAQAIVINYPKFFTPNADGYNDTWNIRDLANQPTATISIYDRFGKLLKQIKPSREGWDGTYNGSAMPSTDYWFIVNYIDENQISQEFKAHFAMKR